MMTNRYFVAGIGTDVGKTVASAILCEALHADYWKPVQAGDLNHSDSIKVGNLIGNLKSKIHPESYKLLYPLSPHASADLSHITVEAHNINLPNTENSLIIEGAGGLMVPINHDTLYIDLIPKFKAEVILVSRHYLGSINHSLLSAEALKSRNISVKGILFIGEKNEATEDIILKLSNLKLLGRIDESPSITKEFILEQSQKFRHL